MFGSLGLTEIIIILVIALVVLGPDRLPKVARQLGKDPLEVRRRNFYGKNERNVTQYLQTVEDNIIEEIFDDSGY